MSKSDSSQSSRVVVRPRRAAPRYGLPSIALTAALLVLLGVGVFWYARPGTDTPLAAKRFALSVLGGSASGRHRRGNRSSFRPLA